MTRSFKSTNNSFRKDARRTSASTSFEHLTPVNRSFPTKTSNNDLPPPRSVDNSGKIDFKEFLQAINITSQGTPDKKLEMAFRMYDCNGDGSIDENEMRGIISVGLLFLAMEE